MTTMGFFLQPHVTVSSRTPEPVCPDRQLSQPGLRYYSTSFGRWISRDPIGEQSARNLYAGLRNSSINRIDAFGLKCGTIKDEGFSSAEEKTLVDKMKAKKPPCPIPQIKCQCCPYGWGGWLSGDGTTVVLCDRAGQTDKDYREVRLHELSHAFDKCFGAKMSCTKDDYRAVLCTEIRARHRTGDANPLKGACGSAAVECQGFAPGTPDFNLFVNVCETTNPDLATTCAVGGTEPLPPVPPPPPSP